MKREKELEEKRKKKEFWFGLDGLDTEDELDKVFEKLGFETETTPPSNDEGIDHVLNGEIVVQTKNQKNKVSRPDLQRFWGSWKDSHKKVIFVSIHGFTSTCEEFVEDKPILLYDVNDVIGMSEGKKPLISNQVKHILIILISFLLLYSPVIGQETGVLYQYEIFSRIKWGTLGDLEIKPKYEDEIKNVKPNGQGIITYPDGRKYVGEWKDGKWNGEGVLLLKMDMDMKVNVRMEKKTILAI